MVIVLRSLIFSSRLKLLPNNILVSVNVKLLSTSSYKSVKDSRPLVSNPEFRVVFLGNDTFSLESLKAITQVVDSKKCVKVVVSNPRNVVCKYAAANSLDFVLWDEFKVQTQENKNQAFDVGVVASFGHLIPKRIIEACKLGILNVHGSLLPKLRGAAPIARSIINGESETGISIMKIAPHRFDIGPILCRRKIDIHPHVRSPELTHLLAIIGSQALKEVLLNLEDSINNVDHQADTEATLAPKLTPDMAVVDWQNLSAFRVYNLFRGLAGFFKLTTFYGDKKVDLDHFGLVVKSRSDDRAGNDNISHSSSTPLTVDSKGKNLQPIDVNTDFSQYYPEPVSLSVSSDDLIWDNSKFVPGQIFVRNNFLFIKCKANDDKGSWVFCKKIKMGTKWMSPKDFQNGFLSKSKGLHVFTMDPQKSEDVVKPKKLKN